MKIYQLYHYDFLQKYLTIGNCDFNTKFIYVTPNNETDYTQYLSVLLRSEKGGFRIL